MLCKNKVGKSIVMACPNYWTSPCQVGSHQFAKLFVKNGWKVAYLSDPISPLHLLSGINPDLRERFRIYTNGGLLDFKDKLWSYLPGALFSPHNKPLLRNEWVLRSWKKFTWPNLVKKLIDNGFGDVELLYFDNNVNYAFLTDVIKFRKTVMRIADKMSAFSKFSTAASKKAEKALAQKVDLVVYSASNLERYVAEMKPRNMMYLPNGVNFKHFAEGSTLKPREYRHIRGPIAIYVGAMEKWFDYNLVNFAAKKLPDVTFVLIGPDHYARGKLLNFENIRLLGSISYQALPGYLHNADVGLIPFDVENNSELVNSVNPIKLYEYMACGLPVVATKWKELELINSPAYLAKDSTDFVNGLGNALQERNRDKYVQFAQNNTWEERYKKLNKICLNSK